MTDINRDIRKINQEIVGYNAPIPKISSRSRCLMSGKRSI